MAAHIWMYVGIRDGLKSTYARTSKPFTVLGLLFTEFRRTTVLGCKASGPACCETGWSLNQSGPAIGIWRGCGLRAAGLKRCDIMNVICIYIYNIFMNHGVLKFGCVVGWGWLYSLCWQTNQRAEIWLQ